MWCDFEVFELSLEKVASGVYKPVPERATFCGLVGSVSAIVRFAVRVPLAEGLNRTLTVQDEPPPSREPHPLVCEKSAAFVPVMLILEIVNDVLPRFRSVTL